MVEKNRGVFYTGFCLVVVAAMCMSVSVVMGDTAKNVHPELSEQEMLIACADCHREVTPEVEKEWYDSVHGIAMVKCYQCHGTFETFALTPTKQNCATCHTNMLDKCPQDKNCWECHVPHSFKAKK